MCLVTCDFVLMYPKLIENAIEHLIKLPGIGRRSAERIVFWLLNHPLEDSQVLAKNILVLKEGLRFCTICNNFSETDTCLICRDPGRDATIICVVEDPKDVLAIERTGSYKGHYHVLLGAISPSDGRGPEDLKIYHLVERVKKGTIEEVVLATDADNEGEMTALYLINQLKPFPVKVSRIGFGLPLGSSVEYADISSLSVSLTSRREVKP